MRFLLSSLPTAAAPPCTTQVHTSLFSTLLQRLLRFVSIPLSLSLSRLVDMCTYFYVWKCCKGMEFHVCSRHILQRLVIIIITQSCWCWTARMARCWFCRTVQHHYYDEMASFFEESQESSGWWNFWNISNIVESFPLIWEYIFMLYEEMPRKFLEGTPAVTKKRSGYISIIQLSCVKLNHKERRGGGTTKKKNEELLGFFLELIYPMFCRVLHYCISDWIEGMKVLLHTKFGSGIGIVQNKVYKCNSWGFIPA